MKSKKFATILSPSSNPDRNCSDRNRSKLATLLLFFVLSISPGQGQTADLSPFEKAISATIDSNHTIHSAKAMLESTKERYNQSFADLLPDVALSASQSRRFVIGESSANRDFIDNSEALSQVSMRLTQPLFKWQSVLALQQAKYVILSAEEDLNATRQDLLLEAIQNIVNVLLTENMAKLAENNLTFTRSNLDATLSRRKAGYLTRTDVDQATARVSSAEAEFIGAKNAAMVARASFEEVVRIPVPEGLNVPDVPPHLLQGDLETLSAKIHNRPAFKSAKLRLDLANHTISMEKAGHFPVVNLLADANTYRGDSGGQIQQDSSYSVSIQFSLPIFSGGKTLSRTREAYHVKASRQFEFDRTHDQLLREVKQAYLEMHSAKATVKSSEVAVSFYSEALKGMQEEFRAGFRTVIDLLESQNQLFRSKTDLVKNRHELLSSQYQLLHTIGLLTLEHIMPNEDNRPLVDVASMPSIDQNSSRLDDNGTGQQYGPVTAKITRKNIPLFDRLNIAKLAVDSIASPIFVGSIDVMKPLNATLMGEEIQALEKQSKKWSLQWTRSLGLHTNQNYWGRNPTVARSQ